MWPNIKNEKGTALIISVLILFLLTLLGMFATDTTNIELLISGNERAYKEAFYNADGGVYYAVAKATDGQIIYGLAPNNYTPLNFSDMPQNVTLSYKDISPGPPSKIEVMSVGTAANGARSTIIAGIEFVSPGKLPGPGNETDF